MSLVKEMGITKGIVYCTASAVDKRILDICSTKLIHIANEMDMEIVSVSLNNPVDIGRNIVVNYPFCKTSIIRQQIIGLENIHSDYVFFCDDDTLYNKTHFDFMPPQKAFYFNHNIWFLDSKTGKTMFYLVKNGSAQSAYRESALRYFNEYISKLHLEEKVVCELGSKFGDKVDVYNSWYAIIDIKHDKNTSAKSFDRSTVARVIKPLHGWTKASGIPHYGTSLNRPIQFLKECASWK